MKDVPDTSHIYVMKFITYEESFLRASHKRVVE
jgi:hypothetical protein